MSVYCTLTYVSLLMCSTGCQLNQTSIMKQGTQNEPGHKSYSLPSHPAMVSSYFNRETCFGEWGLFLGPSFSALPLCFKRKPISHCCISPRLPGKHSLFQTLWFHPEKPVSSSIHFSGPPSGFLNTRTILSRSASNKKQNLWSLTSSNRKQALWLPFLLPQLGRAGNGMFIPRSAWFCVRLVIKPQATFMQ